MDDINSLSKKIPRRYSLTNTEKTTLGKSLLRYIQVSHYFEKPTVNILYENSRTDLIRKQIKQVGSTDLENSKKNESKTLKELNNLLEECIDERVNLVNINQQKSWLKKMVDGNPPEDVKSEITRKIGFDGGDNNHREDMLSDLEDYLGRLRGEEDDEMVCNIHIKSEKGFPQLNFQYNNVEEAVKNWNPPSLTDALNERDFSRKLRVLRKGELAGGGGDNHVKEIEFCEDSEGVEDDDDGDFYSKIPVIGELASEHELDERFEEEDNIYLRQYLDEIKCDANIIDFVKEKNNYKGFKKWLKKNKLRLRKKKIVSDENHLTPVESYSFACKESKDDLDDEARDLHTRNDFRRFDILLDSSIFGYCDYDEADQVLDGIIEIEKCKRKKENHSSQIPNKDKKENGMIWSGDKIGSDEKTTRSDQLKEKLQVGNHLELSRCEDEDDEDEDDEDEDDEDEDEDDEDEDDKDEDDKDECQREDSDYDMIGGEGHNSSQSSLSTKLGKNLRKENNGLDNLYFNRMLNMLLNAGAEIDDNEEKIIKEERREEQSLGRLRMPKSLSRLNSSYRGEHTEGLEEYYERKKRLRIDLRSKVLRERKDEKNYSLQLFYDNPVMLETFVKKMDNQISERKKMYEYEKSERLHLSYRLKFLIERNARLSFSIKKAEREINGLEDEYEDKSVQIQDYSKRLEEELAGLERLQGILINSLGMLSQWCVCEPEYLDSRCTRRWEESSVALVPGGRSSHALLICKRICHFDSRLSKLYNSMYIHNYKAGLKIIKKRAALEMEEKMKRLEEEGSLDKENGQGLDCQNIVEGGQVGVGGRETESGGTKGAVFDNSNVVGNNSHQDEKNKTEENGHLSD